MSDRTFVLAMWSSGRRVWDDAYAVEFMLTSAEAFSRGITSAGTHLRVMREVRDAFNHRDDLRRGGMTEQEVMQTLVNFDHQLVGRTGPSADHRQPGSAATRP